MRWLITGKGMLTYSTSIVAASVKVLEESATPDMQCTFAPGSFKDGQIGELEEMPGISAGAWQTRPLSRGYVEAKSNGPGDMPAINPRYLSDEADRHAIIGGLPFARRTFLAAVEEGKQALQAGQVVDHATVVAAFERVVKPHP
jgi:choline dehydrogenase